MSTPQVSTRLRTSLSALVAALGVAGVVALAPASVNANPVAKPKIDSSKTIAVQKPGTQTYVLKLGKQKKVVSAKTIKVVRGGDKAKTTAVFVDGKKFVVTGLVSVSIATGGESNSGSSPSAYSQTTTTTQLPGGGTRTDIDHGNGSSTTIIHDPHGGKNGGTRTTTSSSDGEGNTTTTTTTTDGSDGSSTTTTTTSP